MSRTPEPGKAHSLNGSAVLSPITPTKLQLLGSPVNRRVPPPLSVPSMSSKSSVIAPDNQLDVQHAKLRRDVLQLQAVIDAARGRNTLSFDARKLEAEVLRSTHEATPDARMAALLNVLEAKVAELAQVAGGVQSSASGIVRPLIDAIVRNGALQLPPQAVRNLDRRDSTPPPSEVSGAAAPPKADLLSADARGALCDLGIMCGDSTPLADVLVDFERIVNELKTKATPNDRQHRGAPRPGDSGTPDVAEPLSRSVTESNAHQTPLKQVAPSSAANASSAITLRDSTAQFQVNLLMEVESLRTRLAAREQELNDVRHHLSASRYASNAQRTLTTVHDAPMSFEVERQYQRELHRLADRVKETEGEYQALYNAGEADRNAVAALTNEVARLNQEIENNQRQMAALARERDEQRDLFTGVSKARGEEARMSLVAVRQLESRVQALTDQLRARTEEAANLETNLEHQWEQWCTVETELARTTSELNEVKDQFEAFGGVFNEYLAYSLEEALREVHRLGKLCDEQIALTTIQKQRIEDSDMLRTLTLTEQQIWMERLKGSTEWKLLSVKSPEETKQLAVRLLMLTGEKEKKEYTMVASHSERLGMFKARAEREVNERAERRETAMPLQEAATFKARWSALEKEISERFTRERDDAAKAGQGGRVTKLRYADVKALYMAEVKKRAVDFRALFNDEVEARAASDVQS